jgi:hypothetical protein
MRLAEVQAKLVRARSSIHFRFVSPERSISGSGQTQNARQNHPKPTLSPRKHMICTHMTHPGPGKITSSRSDIRSIGGPKVLLCISRSALGIEFNCAVCLFGGPLSRSKLPPKFGWRHVCAPTGKSQRGEQHSPMLMMHDLLLHHCLLLTKPLLIILIAQHLRWIHGGIAPLVRGRGRLIVGHDRQQKQPLFRLLHACFIYVYGHQVRNQGHPTRPSDGHVESSIYFVGQSTSLHQYSTWHARYEDLYSY